jgi:hypothetical protein
MAITIFLIFGLLLIVALGYWGISILKKEAHVHVANSIFRKEQDTANSESLIVGSPSKLLKDLIAVGNYAFIPFDLQNEGGQKTELRENVRKYFDTIIGLVGQAKHSIEVIQYVLNSKRVNHHATQDEIAEGYQNYFRAIEGAVKNKGASYTRILQLPIRTKPDVATGELCKIAVDYLLPNELEHLKVCFGYSNFQLYLHPSIVQANSSLSIDKKIILAEYDNYDEDGDPLPNHLFVSEEPESFFLRRGNSYTAWQNEQMDSICKKSKRIEWVDLQNAHDALIEDRRNSSQQYSKIENNILRIRNLFLPTMKGYPVMEICVANAFELVTNQLSDLEGDKEVMEEKRRVFANN